MAGQAVRRSMKGLQSVVKDLRGLKTVVDIVMVLDGTGSMQNLMDGTKARAMEFHRLIKEALANKGRIAENIRVKVIVFRDLYDHDAPAFEESEWFVLREDGRGDERDFYDYISSIRATGGGDLPESGLEALHRAMNVDFTVPMQGQKCRHIIVLMTDDGAHALDDPRRAECGQSYPAGVPASLTELNAQWVSFVNRYEAGRLVLLAPQATPWNSVGTWSSVEYEVCQAGAGVNEDSYNAVITAIAGSIR